MKLIGPGLGEDFNAAVSQFVVLGRERILIDPDFANGSFWRQLARGESVDVHLPAVGPCRRPGQRFQIGLQFIWIVG